MGFEGLIKERPSSPSELFPLLNGIQLHLSGSEELLLPLVLSRLLVPVLSDVTVIRQNVTLNILGSSEAFVGNFGVLSVIKPVVHLNTTCTAVLQQL